MERTMEQEQWKPVVGFEGLYEISSYGRCKGLPMVTDFGNQKKKWPERILKPKTRKGKYSSYILCKDRVHLTLMIHRLVGIHFIPNPSCKPTINHKDGNKQNNHVSNLEWCTYSENLLHALDLGLNTVRKLNVEDVKAIRLSKESRHVLAIKFGVNANNIVHVQKRVTWKHVQ